MCSTISTPADFHGQFPYTHTVRSGENFWTISLLYYRSSRYGKALWAANKDAVPDFDRLTVGDKIIIPPVDQLDPALIEEVPAPAPPVPETVPAAEPATSPRSLPAPPPAGVPGPFGQKETEDPAVKATGGTTPPRPGRSRRRRGSDRLARAEQEGLAPGWGRMTRATAFPVHRPRGFDALHAALLGEDPGRDRVIISDRFPTSPERFVATCQLSGSPGSGWSGRRMRSRSTPTSRCDSTECLSGRSRCTA